MKQNPNKTRRTKWFQRRRRRHDPMLVFQMAMFNSGSGWNQIFARVPQRENVWTY